MKENNYLLIIELKDEKWKKIIILLIQKGQLFMS